LTFEKEIHNFSKKFFPFLFSSLPGYAWEQEAGSTINLVKKPVLASFLARLC